MGGHGPRTQAALKELVETLDRAVPYKRVTVDGTIEEVTRDSKGAILGYIANVDGQQVRVQAAGEGWTVGQGVLLSRTQGQSVLPDWRHERRLPSVKAMSILDDDMSIEPPRWGPLFDSVLDEDPGPSGLRAKIRAEVIETPEAYQPQSLELQYATNADAAIGHWTSIIIGNNSTWDAGGSADWHHTIVIPGLPLGVSYNLRIRTYTIGGARSPFNDTTKTITTESEGYAPPAATGFSVDVTRPNQAIVNFVVSADLSRFDHYHFEYYDTTLAGTPLGSGSAASPNSVEVYSNQWMRFSTVALRMYGRVREVGKTGALGTMYPASGYLGPFTVQGETVQDILPPPTPLAPTLAAGAGVVGNSYTNYIDITLPGYAGGSDFASVQYVIWNTTELYDAYTISPTFPTRVGGLKPATLYNVVASSRDITGNQSVQSPAATITTVALSGPPTVATIVASAGGYRGVWIKWNEVLPSATSGPIVGYRVFLWWASDNVPNLTQVPNHSGILVDATQYTWANLPLPGEAGVPLTNWTGPPGPAGLAPGSMHYWAGVCAVSRNESGALVDGPNLGGQVAPIVRAVQNGDLFANTIHGNMLLAASVGSEKFPVDSTWSNTIRFGAGGVLSITGDAHLRPDGFWVGRNTTYPGKYGSFTNAGIDLRGQLLRVLSDGGNPEGWLEGGPDGFRGMTMSHYMQTVFRDISGTGHEGMRLGYGRGLMGKAGWGTSDPGFYDPEDWSFGRECWYKAPVQNVVRAGARLIPVAASVATVTFGLITANTEYIWYPHSISTWIPSNATAWVVRGFYTSTVAGQPRLYLIGGPSGWSRETGGSVAVAPGETTADFGPWVIPSVAGNNYLNFFWNNAGCNGGQFWITGFYV